MGPRDGLHVLPFFGLHGNEWGILPAFCYCFVICLAFALFCFETRLLYAALAGLEFREISLTLPGMLELQACTTTPNSKFIFEDKSSLPMLGRFLSSFKI